MAVKQAYGIRTAMLSTALDTEITLQKDGVGLRPLPIKFVVVTILSGVLGFKIMSDPPISYGSAFQQGIFIVMWIAMTVLLFGSDATQRFRFQLLISLFNYLLVPTNRKIETPLSGPATPILDMTNIKKVSEDGTIVFADKHYGYMYRVVGTASVLLFDNDKKSIVNSVDNFYRKVDPDTEMIFITLKEPQKIYNQVAAVKKRYAHLTVYDNDLSDLCNNQLTMLREVVGKKYQSIHQYLILRADGLEKLNAAKITLQADLNTSGLFIKRCVPLYPSEILEVLQVIYTAPKLKNKNDVITRADAKDDEDEDNKIKDNRDENKSKSAEPEKGDTDGTLERAS